MLMRLGFIRGLNSSLAYGVAMTGLVLLITARARPLSIIRFSLATGFVFLSAITAICKRLFMESAKAMKLRRG